MSHKKIKSSVGLEAIYKVAKERNEEMVKIYQTGMKQMVELAELLEAAPKEHTLSNGKVAEFLREWVDDMGHIVEMLQLEEVRMKEATDEIQVLERIVKIYK